MISRRTKVQLAVFVLITLLGVSYVGARYARLDRFFFDDSYTVVAHFPDSGGVYAGAEVSYRGVGVGKLDKLVLTDEGVDAHLEIDKEYDEIPADSLALVGNRSALGEQYVELQPNSDEGPYLKDKSELDKTKLPISTTKLLTDVSTTVSSVNNEDLRTVIAEFGLAFDGTGEDLAQIIDTSNEFIEAANENFDVTTALIRDSNTVLKGQLASASAIRAFSRNLSLFSTTLVGSDKDIRKLIDNGGATAIQLKDFLDKNKVELADLLNNLVTTGEIVVRNLDGLEHALVVYPYAVEGGFTVASKDPNTGLYDAHFGAVLTMDPHVCNEGYESTNRRIPENGENWPMAMGAHCAEPPSKSNARGAQNSSRAPADYAGANAGPVVANFDPETGELIWAGQEGFVDDTAVDTVPPEAFGADGAWRWLFLQPLVQTQE